jgi:hypothetical protein
MNITTKFNVSDLVFFMKDNEIHKGTVALIHLTVDAKTYGPEKGQVDINICYRVIITGHNRSRDKEVDMNEIYFFSTPEGLTMSLLNDHNEKNKTE